METKTKYLIGGLAVAFIGAFIWKSKKDADAKALADAKAKADAQAEAQRIAEEQRINDPVRKKIYEDIYVTVFNKNKGNIQQQQDYVKYHECMIKYYNRLSIDELNQYKKYFDAVLSKKEDSITNDPLEYKSMLDFFKKYPELGFDNRTNDCSTKKEVDPNAPKTINVSEDDKNRQQVVSLIDDYILKYNKGQISADKNRVINLYALRENINNKTRITDPNDIKIILDKLLLEQGNYFGTLPKFIVEDRFGNLSATKNLGF